VLLTRKRGPPFTDKGDREKVAVAGERGAEGSGRKRSYIPGDGGEKTGERD